MAGEGQPAQAARPDIVRVYGACAVCRCVLVRIMAAYSKRGAILMRDSQGRMQDIMKGGSSHCAREAREKFSSTTPPFRSRLPLNRAAARKTTKEPVSFLIVAVINKAKTPKIV